MQNCTVNNEKDWSVWRQDDNGNWFEMKTNLTEFEALDLVNEYADKHHKQTYWAWKSKHVKHAVRNDE